LEICRILEYTDSSYRKILGPRPGYPPVDLQVKNLIKSLKEKNIAVSDIGTWTGSTILYLADVFKKHGYKVEEAIFVIATREALENLENNGFSVRVSRVYNLYDWMEIRDFFIAGRVVGENGMPFLYKGKIPVRIPYWSDCYTLKEWASIPEEICEEIRRDMIDITIKYFNFLSEIKGTPVSIEDAGILVPYGLLPNKIKEINFPSNTPLIDVIKRLFIKK